MTLRLQRSDFPNTLEPAVHTPTIDIPSPYLVGCYQYTSLVYWGACDLVTSSATWVPESTCARYWCSGVHINVSHTEYGEAVRKRHLQARRVSRVVRWLIAHAATKMAAARVQNGIRCRPANEGPRAHREAAAGATQRPRTIRCRW